ncbi:MAG TPA: lytic transglycosylase domain-containing protein, partial [Myxococcales bacterium]|nr:lytic transglycosylase domain-containing protein [Myxococcales bacterium]
DRAIRRILKKFDADTYAVPPIFKERLQHYIEVKTSNPAVLRQVYGRKKQFWPIITREFSALGLPEEIAFVAWQESNFDPYAQSAVGARGMWQFMDFQARHYGLKVSENWRKGGYDERTDVQKETHVAAKYLYDLLSEFGSDSFMLAIASYNKGENGMRKVLHEVGFRKDQRDFWHLYRLKKLPEETMEYVPQILAAAIICNDPKKYGLE